MCEIVARFGHGSLGVRRARLARLGETDGRLLSKSFPRYRDRLRIEQVRVI